MFEEQAKFLDFVQRRDKGHNIVYTEALIISLQCFLVHLLRPLQFA